MKTTLSEIELNEAMRQYKDGDLSHNDTLTFLDYFYDEMGTDTHEAVYDAWDKLYTLVMFNAQLCFAMGDN